jgi:hypothetical protein
MTILTLVCLILLVLLFAWSDAKRARAEAARSASAAELTLLRESLWQLRQERDTYLNTMLSFRRAGWVTPEESETVEPWVIDRKYELEVEEERRQAREG